MAKLVLSMFMSLDGYVEGPNGFAPPPWSGDMERMWAGENLTGVGRLLYGRVNFLFNRDFWSSDEAAAAPHATIMNSLPKTVVSATLTGDPGWNGEIVSGDLTGAVARLKRETQGDIQSFGGAGLADSLIRADLVDVYRLLLVPVLQGGGKRLFTDGRPAADLALTDARRLDTGAMLLTYAKA